MSRFLMSAVALVFSAFGAVHATAMPYQAPYIVRPTDATFSVANFGTAVPSRAIDNSGLASTLNTLDPVPGVYPGHGNVGHPSDASLTNNTQTFTMTYDLGAVYDLNQTASMHFWNYNETGALGRGVRLASIYYTDLGTSIGTATGWTLAASGATFAPGDGLTSYTGADYTFLNNVTARFVRFDVTANHSNTLPGGDYTGISELRFITAEVFPHVPEPATLVLLGMGLGGISLLARRRRRN